ncbi:hypothetical protein K445DRAFT_13548 [Daldinia sp. EC12]|nr:hypothetical protein K445DRAFT_13548 [Daldinia sp. EC12]
MAQPQQSLDTLVDERAGIKKRTFKVTVGVVFIIAIISVLARAAIRFKTRRRLFVDDYLLFIAATFLAGSTGVIYHFCNWLYLTMAIQKDPSIVSHPDTQDIIDYINTFIQKYHAFLVISWTALVFVKFSFLAFFKQLIRQVQKIRSFYWAVAALTVISWMFLIAATFILCPELGAESVACWTPFRSKHYIVVTGVTTSLDVLSDILIASIPIIVLHLARIRNSQKISLGLFLCLSLVMVCFSIVRVSGVRGELGLDVPWKLFWQYVEASVAVTMGSLTVFRSLLTLPTRNSDEERRNRVEVVGLRSHEHFSCRMRLLRLRKEHLDLESQNSLPDIPGATMTGMRTFIRCNNHDPGLAGVSQQNTLSR